MLDCCTEISLIMLHKVISCVVDIEIALGNVGAGLSMKAMNREGSTGTAQFRSGPMGAKVMGT